MPTVTTIAIDGPVASGKTVVGMRIADALGIRFLDSGAMYRAVTLAALRGSLSLSDDDALTSCASMAELSLGDAPVGTRVLLDGEDVTDRLRDPEVEGAVSRVAAVAGVRHVLVSKQQAVAADGPIVMVGRDIGTVVLLNADVKAFLQASVEGAGQASTRRAGRDGQGDLAGSGGGGAEGARLHRLPPRRVAVATCGGRRGHRYRQAEHRSGRREGP